MMIEKGLKMTEFEKNCYGMTEADIREEYMGSITARLSGLEMVAMGVLSDAQELMTFGHDQAIDQARKNINIAKFILSEMMESKLTGLPRGGHSIEGSPVGASL
jgi:hypothetical protein